MNSSSIASPAMMPSAAYSPKVRITGVLKIASDAKLAAATSEAATITGATATNALSIAARLIAGQPASGICPATAISSSLKRFSICTAWPAVRATITIGALVLKPSSWTQN